MSQRPQFQELQKACAEMRDCISNLLSVLPHEKEGFERASAAIKARELLESTDCGSGWKSPQEYAALEAKCAAALKAKAELKRVLSVVVQHAPGYDWNADPKKLTLLTGHALSDECGSGFSLSGNSDEMPQAIEHLVNAIEDLVDAIEGKRQEQAG